MMLYGMYSVTGMLVGFCVASYAARSGWRLVESVTVTVAIGFPIAALVELWLFH